MVHTHHGHGTRPRKSKSVLSLGPAMSYVRGNLFRYIPFHHLIEIFEKKALSFSRPRDWEDPYESRLADDDMSKSMYAQCWSRLPMSDAMWRIYSPDHLSVRIRATREVLKAQVRRGLSKTSNGADTEMKVRRVKYLSTGDADREVNKMRLLARSDAGIPVCDAISFLFIKRTAFEHEKETRVVVYKAPQVIKRRNKYGLSPSNPKRLSIPVEPHKLIESVFFDSRAPDELCRAFKHYLRKELEYAGRVGKSGLYRDEQDD
jgi:hypothetical protein